MDDFMGNGGGGGGHCLVNKSRWRQRTTWMTFKDIGVPTKKQAANK